MADLLIHSARSHAWNGPGGILVQGGRIAAIGPGVRAGAGGLPPEAEWNADGRVVIPAFSNIHTHLDKALTRPADPDLRETAHDETRLERAIRQMRVFQRTLTVPDVATRARSVLRSAVASGTTAVRSHVDVGLTVGLKGMEALVGVQQALSDTIDLQLTVMATQPGWRFGGGPLELVEEALRMGAAAIGGIPNFDPDPVAHIDTIFRLATRYAVDIDLHVDESDDPDCLTLAYLAEKCIAEGFQGRVIAGHCSSLGVVPDDTARRVIDRVVEAGITVVTLPAANLYLLGQSATGPLHRGVTRVRELQAAGAAVAYATDNIQDPFVPIGTVDMMSVGALTGFALQYGSPADLVGLLAMGTEIPSSCMRPGEPVGLRPGARADLVLLDSHDPGAIFAEQPTRLAVWRAGRLVAASRLETVFPAWRE